MFALQGVDCSLQNLGDLQGGLGGTAAAFSSSSGGASASSSSSTRGVDPDPVRPVLACGATACSDLAMIVDMEVNDGAVCSTDGRIGTCFVFNDGTGSQWPKPDGSPLTQFSPIESCRGESAVALHTKGAGFTSWGAGTACYLAYGTGVWDASAYTRASGTFWARSSTMTRSMAFGVVSAPRPKTRPTAGRVCHPEASSATITSSPSDR